jgi:DivIVA domain-containing protein
MAGDLPRPLHYPGSLTPDEVRRRGFPTSFRGFDTGEVRAYLESVAGELTRLAQREDELVQEIHGLRQRLANPKLDEETLTAALGHEAAQILHSAHEAGADIRRKAEDNAARVLREAHAQAEALRQSAESLLAERTREAEAAADALKAAANAESAALLARARQEAEGSLGEARIRFEAMEEEAEALKNRVLGEISRRRRAIVAQIEQLTAGRDSMLRAVGDVRALIDQVAGSLDGAELEAKAAAEAALASLRQRGEVEPLTTEELGPLSIGAAALGDPPPTAEAVILRLQTGADLPRPPLRPAARPAEPAPPASSVGVVVNAESSGGSGPEVGGGAQAGAPAPVEPPAERGQTALTEPGDAGRQVGAAVGSGPSSEAAGGPGDIIEGTRPGLRVVRREESSHPSIPLEDLEEGVRIIGPATPLRPAPLAPVPSAPEPPRNQASSAAPPAAPPAATEPTATEPTATEPTATEPTATEPTATEPTATEPTAAVVTEEPKPREPRQAPPAPERPSVDELFARLRAERAAAVDSAAETLAQAGPPRASTADEEGTAGAEGPGAEVAPGGDGITEASAEASEGAETAVGDPDDPGSDDADPEKADPENADDLFLQRRNDLLAPVQERLARKIKRSLQDDQNDVLDRVRNSTRHRDQPVLPAVDVQAARFVEVTEPILAEAVEAGVAFGLGLGGEPAGGSVAGAAPVAAELAGALLGQLRPRLEAAVAEGGPDESAVAEGISVVYRAWRSDRLESLAMDHLIVAFHAGLLGSLPGGAELRWVVDDDGAPCPDCDDNTLAGPTRVGEDYPTGQRHPPAHPGCRCLLVMALP